MDSQELSYLIRLRRDLHRRPELAGAEHQTAVRIREELESLHPDALVDGLGGHGVAVTIDGTGDGPTVLVRADMDALPVDESLPLEHASRNPGVAHKCGHDGHMAMAVGVARSFARIRPARGRLIVLFQPAEETGEGAAKVIADGAFEGLTPDVALAVHNLPGFDLGRVVIRSGPFACASRGLVVELTGATSHAAEPEHGRSPALGVAQIIEGWTAARQLFTALDEGALATVIHAAVGRPAFGTSPGDGCVMATLRAASDQVVRDLEARLRRIAERIADAWELSSRFSIREPFPATVNEAGVVGVVVDTASSLNFSVSEITRPFAWSEDFGHFGAVCPSALIGLGSGVDMPALHHPAYDFPDRLIPTGVALLEAGVRHWLGRDG